MTIPKPKKLYYAGAGMRLDGNKVEKWHDIAREYGEIPAAGDDQTFAGADRPELMQGWDNATGVGSHQVAIEKEATNVNRESLNLGWEAGLTKTIRYGSSPYGDQNETCLIEFIADENDFNSSIRLPVSGWSVNENEFWTLSFWAKRVSGDDSTVGIRVDTSDSSSIFTRSISTEMSVWEFFEFTFQIPTGDNSEFSSNSRIRNAYTPPDVKYEFWEVQIERGRYATNRIRTEGTTVTRLEPESQFVDFLPKDEATIAGWCDLVYDSDNPTRIFDSAGALSTHRSLLGIELDAGNLSVLAQIFGSDGGQIIELLPFAVNDYQRIRFGYAISYNADTLTLWLVGHDGAAYKFSINHDVNDTTEIDIFIGARFDTLQTSTRHEVAPGVHAYTTDDQMIKNMLSALSRYEGGANLSQEQITIQ